MILIDIRIVATTWGICAQPGTKTFAPLELEEIACGIPFPKKNIQIFDCRAGKAMRFFQLEQVVLPVFPYHLASNGMGSFFRNTNGLFPRSMWPRRHWISAFVPWSKWDSWHG